MERDWNLVPTVNLIFDTRLSDKAILYVLGERNRIMEKTSRPHKHPIPSPDFGRSY